MKKLFARALPLLLFSFLFVTASPATTEHLALENITLQKMDFASTENAWFLLKCDINNTTDESGIVEVILQSIDKNAYKRKVIRLYGHVEAGEKATLTLTSYMEYKMYDDIRKWQIERVEIL